MFLVTHCSSPMYG